MPKFADRTTYEQSLSSALSQAFLSQQLRVQQASRAGLTPDWQTFRLQVQSLVQRQIQPLVLAVGAAMPQSSASPELLLIGASNSQAMVTGMQLADEIVASSQNRLAAGELPSSVFSDARASTVAVTEVTRAVSQAEHFAAATFQTPDRKLVPRWKTEIAGVCPVCDQFEDTGPEVYGDDYPDGPPAHPNCRCYLDWVSPLSEGYNPDEPRDDHGQWTDGDGGSSSRASSQKLAKSKAKVEVLGREEKDAAKIVQKHLGIDIHDLPSLVGAPDDATVDMRVSPDGTTRVSIRHPAISRCDRTIAVDDSGKKFIHNNVLEIKDQFQKAGIGSKIFSAEVEHAKQHGFAYIETHAAREGGWNGYYTWPRLGYDQPLDELDRGVASAAQRKFPGAKSVLDVMQTKEGRDWWKEHGDDMTEARFDLTPGSRSLKIHDAYMKERASKSKAA